jgi:hypothetical protein
MKLHSVELILAVLVQISSASTPADQRKVRQYGMLVKILGSAQYDAKECVLYLVLYLYCILRGSQSDVAYQINFGEITPYSTNDCTVYVCADYRMNMPEKHTSGKTRQ